MDATSAYRKELARLSPKNRRRVQKFIRLLKTQRQPAKQELPVIAEKTTP